jgi:hypothetical protein
MLLMSLLSKDKLIDSIIDNGSKTGQFSASRGKDTDITIETKIIDIEYDGDSGREKIDKTYRAYILLDESTQEAKYYEEIAESSQGFNAGVSTGNISFGTSKSFSKGKTIGHAEFEKTWSYNKRDNENNTNNDNNETAKEKGRNISYDIKQIQRPIEQMLSQNGWKLSLVTSKKDAPYKKEKYYNSSTLIIEISHLFI